jgi:hypothetical protein
MSTTSAPGWHVIARHKIVALLVAVAAGLALTIALVLALGSEPAASQVNPTSTTLETVAPGYQFDCHPRLVVSYC